MRCMTSWSCRIPERGARASCDQTLSIFGHDLTSPPIGILIHIAMAGLRAPSESAG